MVGGMYSEREIERQCMIRCIMMNNSIDANDTKGKRNPTLNAQAL